MTGTIASHIAIMQSNPICVNIRFSHFFTIVGFPIFFTLGFELPVMEQEVSTALLFWQFSSDNFSFHNSLQLSHYYSKIDIYCQSVENLFNSLVFDDHTISLSTKHVNGLVQDQSMMNTATKSHSTQFYSTRHWIGIQVTGANSKSF
jgi:hypothetical protein